MYKNINIRKENIYIIIIYFVIQKTNRDGKAKKYSSIKNINGKINK